jgi:hypothetical protein
VSILRTLNAVAIDKLRVRRTRKFALGKWLAFALAELLLGVGALLGAAPELWVKPAGALQILAGIAGFGCFKWPKLVGLAMAGFALAVLACLVAALMVKVV